MKARGCRQGLFAVGLVALLPVAAAAWSPASGWLNPSPSESRRMARAKDFIADEQWTHAIEELRAAVADTKEPNKDEALFWLAHSQNQESDFAAAVEAIRRLEREFTSSRWVKPARSLLIELAHKLRRDDVLWWTAVPAPRRPAGAPPASPPRPGGRAPERAPRVDPTTVPPHTPGAASAPFVPSEPPFAWIAETWSPDSDQRILALGSLIHTNEDRVIDELRHIALEDKNPGAARRAVFVLARSRKPTAQSVVVEAARRGPETVRVAAVRELGRFGGPEVSQMLLQVYSTAPPLVKRQVVSSLGARAEAPALFRIAQSEANRHLRDTAIVTLGQAGGREQLGLLYSRADRESKRPIIVGLFRARGVDELIRIADQEKDQRLRGEVLSRLRLLGTPKARAYLEKAGR